MAGWYVGIDGGGSHTRLTMVDDQGAMVKQCQDGPTNVLVVGRERAHHAVSELLRQVPQPVLGLVAGIAGADREWLRAWWYGVLRPWAARCWVVGDYRVALATLTRGGPGLVAVLGTGSVVYGEGPQRTIKIGGYGGKIGDAASGLHLGWRTIQAALADLEGYGAKTDMTAKVCDWAQTTTAAGLLEAIYQPGFDERRVSDLAVPCLELAARDAVCCQIVEHEGRILIAQLRTAWLALGASPTLPVGLAGGLSRWWLPFLAPMAAELGISIPLTTVTAVPSEGAAYLARRWSRDVSDATEDTQEH